MTKPVGMWAELGRLRPGTPQPSIFDFVQARPLPDADRVADYLRGGHVLIDVMDIQADVFAPEMKLMNGPSIATDGEYYWRLDLAHYVGRRNLTLPQDFLAEIRHRHYIVPDVDEATLERITVEVHPLLFWGSGSSSSPE